MIRNLYMKRNTIKLTKPVDDDHPRRLQFGFAPELEKLIHEKVESSAHLYV